MRERGLNGERYEIRRVPDAAAPALGRSGAPFPRDGPTGPGRARCRLRLRCGGPPLPVAAVSVFAERAAPVAPRRRYRVDGSLPLGLAAGAAKPGAGC